MGVNTLPRGLSPAEEAFLQAILWCEPTAHRRAFSDSTS